jgi:hypothetical protein
MCGRALLVTLTLSDDTAAMLLIDFLDLFISLLDADFLRLWDDHISNTDGTARFGGFAEAKGFQAIKSEHGLVLADSLVAAPNDVGNLFLADIGIDEADVFRPDFIEADAASGGFDDDLGRIAISTLRLVVVRVAIKDLVVHR